MDDVDGVPSHADLSLVTAGRRCLKCGKRGHHAHDDDVTAVTALRELDPDAGLRLCSPDWEMTVSRFSSGFEWHCACGEKSTKLFFDRGAEARARNAWFAHKYPGWADVLPGSHPGFRLRLPSLDAVATFLIIYLLVGLLPTVFLLRWLFG